jgi:hypothetical protein
MMLGTFLLGIPVALLFVVLIRGSSSKKIEANVPGPADEDLEEEESPSLGRYFNPLAKIWLVILTTTAPMAFLLLKHSSDGSGSVDAVWDLVGYWAIGLMISMVQGGRYLSKTRDVGGTLLLLGSAILFGILQAVEIDVVAAVLHR